MISDIVLLKELPGFIKKSIEAYIGCLSGAIMKDEYIKAIKEAGFQDVRIIGKSHFPIVCMANDPTARAIMKNLKMPPDDIGKVISIMVSGIKPDKRAT